MQLRSIYTNNTAAPASIMGSLYYATTIHLAYTHKDLEIIACINVDSSNIYIYIVGYYILDSK